MRAIEHRAAKLVRFVVAHCWWRAWFETHSCGAPILDIAGGSGSVSIELLRRRVSAHVVDPRPTSLTKHVRDVAATLSCAQ
jgi:ubiquinone/menaquinone biosynthesis C-methylase UbiE